MKNIKKVISLFDLHIPNNIDLKPICDFIKDEQPDVIILGGDFMDMESLSHWALAGGKRLTLEGKRFQKECDIAKEVIIKLKSCAKNAEIVYLEGNHEDWVNQYINQHPEMEGIINLPKMLDLDRLNVKWIPYKAEKNYYKIGKLYYTHGEYTCSNHAKKMLETWNCNIRYGHLHNHLVWSRTSKKGIGDFHKAISIPCLCRNGDYMVGKSNNWSHGFHIAYILPSGNFYEYVIQIIDNTFCYNNKIYK
jgi:predicted MPP superfamily phosphohydrolase